MTCAFEDHFTDDGVLTLQPWMQWRHVDSVQAASKAGSYGVTIASDATSTGLQGTLGSLFGGILGSLGSVFGGLFGGAGPDTGASAAGNKNDLLHSLQRSYTNDTPIDQWVYGTITRGGARVTLQARSRGGLMLLSGYKQDVSDPGPLTECSMLGVGADIGRGGTLAIGTSLCVIEARQNSLTFPLAPERTGWWRLPPGETLTAKVELRFVSELWETTSIDGGDSGAESSYETGASRLDLFAVPVI